MTRRLQGVRIDPPSASNLQEVGRSGAVHGRTVERRHLKSVDAPKKGKNIHGAGEADASQADLLSAAFQSGRSIDEILTEFVRPRIADVSIMRRASLLLNECVDSYLPQLEGSENLRSLAAALIGDEIGRHENIIGRLREEA
jgi:hypothetical protein